MYLLSILLVILFLCLASYLVMVIKGPSVWERLLGLNLVSTKIIVIVLIFASLQDTSYLLDYAIIFALIGYLSTIFITLFWKAKQRRMK